MAMVQIRVVDLENQEVVERHMVVEMDWKGTMANYPWFVHMDHLVTFEVVEVLEVGNEKSGEDVKKMVFEDDDYKEKVVLGDGANISVQAFKHSSLLSLDIDEEEMTEGETGQNHGKRHGAFAFFYDFLHSINDHRSELELSSDG
ncbi:hypothetical protein Tco_0832606 [Tanacetum coccineum]